MKNPTVVIWSIVAILCVILAVLTHWLFILPAIIIIPINQKLLFGNKNKKKD